MPFGASTRRPGILDEGFLENVPNVFPAGEGPWISGQPTSSWPTPGINKAFGSTWLSEVDLPKRWEQDPRGLLEPGTGFGSEGRSINVPFPEFPMFPFFGFPGFGVMQQPVAPPSGENPTTEPDYLQAALKAGDELLKALKPGPPKPSNFLGTEVVNKGMQDVWGFSPNDNPNFSLFDSGQPTPTDMYQPGTGLGVDTNINLPDAWDIGYGGAGPSASTLVNSPLFGGPAGPSLGFGVEPVFGLENIIAEGGPSLTLSGGQPASLAASAPTSALNWAGPTAAAGAAFNQFVPMMTDDPKTAAALRGIGGAAQVAGTLGALGMGGATAAGGALAVPMLPLVVGPIVEDILKTNNWFGHAKPPTGFIPIPDANGRDSGNYASPQTGVIIQRDGRYGFKLSDQSKNRQPITPEQARQWGIPIPNVDIQPEDMLRSNPGLFRDVWGLSESPTDLYIANPDRAYEIQTRLDRLRRGRTTGARTPIGNDDVNLLFDAELENAKQLWRQINVEAGNQ